MKFYMSYQNKSTKKVGLTFYPKTKTNNSSYKVYKNYTNARSSKNRDKHQIIYILSKQMVCMFVRVMKEGVGGVTNFSHNLNS